MQDHYLPHQYDLSKIMYDKPEIISEDNIIKKTIKIYDTKRDKPLYIQTPELMNVFGIIKKKNYSEVLLPLGGIQCLVFKNFISNLENKILKDANLNKNSWFSIVNSESESKKINNKSVKYVPIIKEINKGVTSSLEQTEDLDRCNDGVIKIKIIPGTIIKRNSEEISVDELKINNKMRMILQIYAVWITINSLDDNNTSYSSTFGVYLKPEIIEERTNYNLNFLDDDKIIFESDEEEDNSESEDSDQESEPDGKEEK